jgi:hypothetical protein
LDNAVTLGDISNPAAPLPLLVLKNGTFGFNDLARVSAVALSGNLLVIAAADSEAVTLVDVSNPANPVLRATLKDGVGGFEGLSGPAGVALSGNLLAIAAENDGAVTLVDVSNPGAPVKLAELFGGGDFALSGASSLAFSGNQLAVASRFDSSVTLLDVSNPSSPTLLATAKHSVGGANLLQRASGVAWAGTRLIVAADASSAYSVLAFPIEQAGLISSGWAGIGTSRPVAPLHVVGDVVVENAGLVDLNATRVELGLETTASGFASTAMGSGSTASGSYSTATGFRTIASGSFSTAMGANAGALHSGTFVWNGSGGTFNSTAANQFLIRANNVGIDTTSPGAKLDVRGDIRLGSSGQFFAPSGLENLRIIRGVVQGSGTILAGTGFTVTKGVAGFFTITFTTPFSTMPTVTVTAQSGIDRMATCTSITTSSTGIFTRDSAGTAVDNQFNFIAIGPR